MSNSESFIDEVTEEVRRDKLFAVMRKYGWIGILLVAVIVGGTAWTEWQKSERTTRARAFGDAILAATQAATPEARRTALAAIPAELRADDKFKGLVTGLEATGRELTNVFARHGLTKIEAMGQPLDPNRHQAMVEMPSDAEPGTIVQEMQSGWMIKDRLLRPALVAVAKKPD